MGVWDSQSSQPGCVGWGAGPSGAVGAAGGTASYSAVVEACAGRMEKAPQPAEPSKSEG